MIPFDRFEGYPDIYEPRLPRYEPDYMQDAKERMEEEMEDEYAATENALEEAD